MFYSGLLATHDWFWNEIRRESNSVWSVAAFPELSWQQYWSNPSMSSFDSHETAILKHHWLCHGIQHTGPIFTELRLYQQTVAGYQSHLTHVEWRLAGYLLQSAKFCCAKSSLCLSSCIWNWAHGTFCIAVF